MAEDFVYELHVFSSNSKTIVCSCSLLTSSKVKGVNCVECKLLHREYRVYKVLIIKLCHCNVLRFLVQHVPNLQLR